MKRLALSLALLLAAPAAASAREHHFDTSCHIDSPYDLQLTAQLLRFTRADGTPRKIEMDHGRLFVDGKEQKLSDADRARIAEYEASVRALVPQVKAIARDAANIAYTAVGEVAIAFGGDHGELRAKLDRMHERVRERIDASFDSQPWNEKEFEALVESTVQEMVPALVGELTSMAVKAALSGDESVAQDMERRADKLEHEIESRVETESRRIEARAEALCPQLVQLTRIEAELDVRLPDGSRISLIDAHN